MAYYYPDTLRGANYHGAMPELETDRQLDIIFPVPDDPLAEYEVNRPTNLSSQVVRDHMETVFSPQTIGSISRQGSGNRLWTPSIGLLELSKALMRSGDQAQITQDGNTEPLSVPAAEKLAAGFVKLGVATSVLTQRDHAVARNRRGLLFPSNAAPEGLHSVLAINHPGWDLECIKVSPRNMERDTGFTRHLGIRAMYSAEAGQMVVSLNSATTVWITRENGTVAWLETHAQDTTRGSLAAFARPVLQYRNLPPKEAD